MKLDNGYQCDFCKSEFANIEELTNHFVEVHKDSKRCDVCNRTFTSKSNFQLHFLYTHNEIVSKKCVECNKKYASASMLRIQFIRTSKIINVNIVVKNLEGYTS